MLMDCKKCGRNFIPAKKNIKHCNKCVKKKKIEEDEEESDDGDDSTSQSKSLTNIVEEDEVWGASGTPIREGETLSSVDKPTFDIEKPKNQVLSGELMIGHVNVEFEQQDNNSNKPTIKQQLSELNNKLNDILKSLKLNTNVSEIDDSETITNRVSVLLDKTGIINNSIMNIGSNNSNNTEIVQLLENINNKIDANSSLLEHMKALI